MSANGTGSTRTSVFKLCLAIATAVIFRIFFHDWIFAAILMINILVHEQGHLWAMRRCGLKTRGFFFIPALGGVALGQKGEVLNTRQSEFMVAIMGPVAGMLLSTASFAAYLAAGPNVRIGRWALVSAVVGAFINLANLLPLPMLDGNMAFSAIVSSLRSTKTMRIVWVAGRLLAFLALSFYSPVLLVIAIILGGSAPPYVIPMRLEQIKERYDGWLDAAESKWEFETASHWQAATIKKECGEEAVLPVMSRRGLKVSSTTYLALGVALLAILIPAYRTVSRYLAPQTQAAGTVVDPGTDLPGVAQAEYEPGLADRFASYTDPEIACREWTKLPEAERFGLVFVAPTAVPKCASRKYADKMIEAHKLVERAPWPTQGYPRYYELGSPRETDIFSSRSYTCDDIQRLVSDDFSAQPYPQLSPDQLYRSPTPEWLAAYKQWENQDQWASFAGRLYEEGGDFPEGCYPPAAVFGADNQISFSPHQPVHSLRESAAPVFNSPAGSTMIGVGPIYKVVAGDTLASIATCFYGWSGWEVLAFSNRISDVRTLQIGQEIHVPGISDTSRCRE